MTEQDYPNRRDFLIGARRGRGLRLLDVANAANISKPYYRLVELGERTPPEAVAKAIGRVVGVDYQKILEEERCKP